MGSRELSAAFAGRAWAWLTALVDHVERDVGEVVEFERVVGRAGECAYEDRVVLRRDEGDGGEAQVRLPVHFSSWSVENTQSKAKEAFT